MNKSIRTILLFSLALAAAGCGGKTSEKAADAVKTDEATLINVATAVSQDVVQDESYSSTVEAYAVNNIAPQSSLRIQKINVEVGDYVSKGQILAEMDKVSTVQAKLKYANDSTELARIRSLYEEGGVSKSDYDSAVLACDVSKTTYENLLENSVLRSPISGVISARNYDKGDMYSMGSPIYVVQQITPVKLLVGISESDYTKVHKGDKVSITTDAIPGRTFEGKITLLYPTIDQTSHTFTAEVQVPNSDRALRPGMYAKVAVTFGVNHSVVVPDEAVVKQQGSGQRFVFVLQSDNTVKSVLVGIGRHVGDSYEILSGLSEGDVVATKGSANLRDGSKVKVAE
jgi:membrane fusion protein, multidrug efflux system